jgi:cytoskeletal protein RodZ
MNKKIIYLFSIVLTLVLVGAVSVYADQNEKNNQKSSDNATSSDEATSSINNNDLGEATSSDSESESESDSDNATSSSMGEQHRSEVAKVVQSLVKVANKDSNIGEEVRAVAQQEKDSGDKVKEKMNTVEKRNGFKTFLIGSDYKNLGDLRSELVTTQNNLDRLNAALEKTTSSTTKAELQTQIDKLSTILTNAKNFIKSEEGKFSLFGWLLKMFNK